LQDQVDQLAWTNLNCVHAPFIPTRIVAAKASPSTGLTTSAATDGSLASPAANAMSTAVTMTQSIIDWAFTSDPSVVDNMVIGGSVILQDVSDHCSLSVTLNHSLLERSPASLSGTELHSFSASTNSWHTPPVDSPIYHTKGQQYKESLALLLAPWLEVWTERRLKEANQCELEQAWNQLMQALTTCALQVYKQKHAVNNRPQPSYFFRDPRMLQAYTNCRKAESNFRRSPTLLHDEARKAAVKQRDKICYEVQREYWLDFQDQLEDDQKRIVWSIWHRCKGAGSKSIANVKNADGVLPASKLESVTNLAQFYANVSDVRNVKADIRVDSLVTSQVGNSMFRQPAGFGSSHSLPGDPNYQSNESFWTLKEVHSAMKHIPLNTALGPDNIHPIFLRFGGRPLASCLHRLFNASWQTGYVFHSLRVSNVIALFKKGDRSQPGNYRPISLTSVIARMYERMVQPRLLKMIEPKLHQLQFGFRSNRSTYDNLLHIQHQIASATLHNARIPTAFLDISKAFDKVHHSSLLYKLGLMGVKGHLWSFVAAFLRDREMRCMDGDIASPFFPVHSGVPQGSVLGPLVSSLHK
jgi:hypothetical protein